jgi:hypothetical protein
MSDIGIGYLKKIDGYVEEIIIKFLPCSEHQAFYECRWRKVYDNGFMYWIVFLGKKIQVEF